MLSPLTVRSLAAASAVLLSPLSVVESNAALITASEISDAAPSPDTANLGTASLTIDGVTFTAAGGLGNLGWENAGSGAPESIGVTDSFSRSGRISSGLSTGGVGPESFTIDFGPAGATVSQIVLARFGNNDVRVDIAGFSANPGATSTGNTAVATYDSVNGIQSVTPNGFNNSFEINFANPVTVQSLVITSPTTDAGSGGVGFTSVTYTPIPEPGSLTLVAVGVAAFLMRRRDNGSRSM